MTLPDDNNNYEPEHSLTPNMQCCIMHIKNYLC